MTMVIMMKTMIMLMMMTMEAQRKERMLLRHLSAKSCDFHKEIPIIMMRQADLDISERKDLALISVCN